MRTHAYLLVNPASGDGSPSADELAAAARERGVEVRLLEKEDDPGELARASGAQVLGIAGGDGSLAAVAEAALDTDAAFVCIPFGTRNHFARDIGLDRKDPLGALGAFDDGALERRIDVGQVNDHLFVNNVSLGAYAGLVHRRERRRRRGEALARLRALAAVAHHRHHLHVRVNGDPVSARVLLIGNNCYEISLFTLGERARLDAGELHLWSAGGGWLPTAWEDHVAEEFRIELPDAHVRAAIDGEPVLLEPPLVFTSLPGALRVRIPDEGGDEMHDNPRATEDEQEQAQTDRQNEEEAMRYPSDAQPDAPSSDEDAEE